MIKNGVWRVHPGEVLREDYLVPLGGRLHCGQLDETKNAMRLMAEKTRVIAEGAGALSVAAALTGKVGVRFVAIVSGGNVDLKKFCEIIGS